jgi:chromosomal replication initiator protein
MSSAVDNFTSSVDNQDPVIVWKQALELIQKQVNPQTYRTWFLPITPLRLEGRRLTIEVPSQFFYEWLEEHYPHIIRQALCVILGDEAVPIYSILQKKEQQGLQTIETPRRINGHYMGEDTHLNSRYTFDTFVEGTGNQFAKAASLAVSEAPGGTSFNPLVLYGGVGPGENPSYSSHREFRQG